MKRAVAEALGFMQGSVVKFRDRGKADVGTGPSSSTGFPLSPRTPESDEMSNVEM
jgi:hypothetical protein